MPTPDVGSQAREGEGEGEDPDGVTEDGEFALCAWCVCWVLFFVKIASFLPFLFFVCILF